MPSTFEPGTARLQEVGVGDARHLQAGVRRRHVLQVGGRLQSAYTGDSWELGSDVTAHTEETG